MNAAIEQSEVKYRCHMYETTDRDSVYESYIIPRNRSASFQAGLEPGVSSNSFDIPLPAGDRLHVSESSYNSYSMLPPPTSPEIGRNVSTSSRRDSTESRASARPPTRPTTSGNTSKTHVHRGPASIVVSGSEYCFSQYLPNCQHSTVMLGFMLEDLGGNPSADKRYELISIY